jgi:hypothetical protein
MALLFHILYGFEFGSFEEEGRISSLAKEAEAVE